MKRKKQDFISSLKIWYKKNKRDLPFRKTKDPYSVWLSEIILQQTRMRTGLVYYKKFKKKYPNLKSLSDARGEVLLKDWEGLGYYNRVKNLHSTAKFIQKKFSGTFPGSQKELIKLKGIGRYSSSAIASICFNEKTPAIDGNVFRILSRVFGIKKNISSSSSYSYFYKKSLSLIKQFKNAGDYNQSLMDFGSVQCLPKNPLCGDCIQKKICYAFIHKKQDCLPVKKKKAALLKRFFNYYVFSYKNRILIKKRGESDVWAGLVDFYLEEKKKKIKEKNKINNTVKKLITKKCSITFFDAKTKLSHQEIFISFIEIKLFSSSVFKTIEKNLDLLSLNKKELNKLAKPKVINDYLKKIS